MAADSNHRRPDEPSSDGDRPSERPSRRPPRRPPASDDDAPNPRAVPHPALAAVDELEVEIEKLVAGGDGLARHEGVPLFVPRSAPGDRLRVRLTEARRDYGRAEIVEILEPGPGRREPPCPYFGTCGGCDLQHLEDDLQVRLKAEAVVETLGRLGKLSAPDDLRMVAGDPWAWRQRTQLHVDRPAEGPPAVGYHERGSHDLVAVDRCPILVSELEGLLPRLPEVLGDARAREGRIPHRLDLAAGDDGVSTAPVVDGLPHGAVESRVGDFTYRWDARCFFQGHRSLAAELVNATVGSWEGETAVDLYAGVGLFSLPLARRYRRVVAVEGDRVAVRWARLNRRRAVEEHGSMVEGGALGVIDLEPLSVESWIDRLGEEADRVVVDPPRAGLALSVRAALARRPPRRLTYVSCHPAALARDLKRLTDVYHFESLVLLDLFPQSGHMEAVAQLVRR